MTILIQLSTKSMPKIIIYKSNIIAINTSNFKKIPMIDQKSGI